MKKTLYALITLLALISCNSKKENHEKKALIGIESIVTCNSEILLKIYSKLERNTELKENDFDSFFENMSSECSKNSEFSQFNNELIFKTLNSQPVTFINSLNKFSKHEKFGLLLNELESPISDSLNLQELLKKTSSAETSNLEIKKLIIESIEKAISKLK